MSAWGSSTAAPVAGAHGNCGSDNGHEGGRLWRLSRRSIAVNIAKLPSGAAADIEGHPAATELGEPGRLRASVNIQTLRGSR